MSYYVPGWDVVALFGGIALLPFLFVVWTGRLWGWPGALSTTIVILAACVAMWLLPARGAHGPPYTLLLSVPLIFGALLGMLVPLAGAKMTSEAVKKAARFARRRCKAGNCAPFPAHLPLHRKVDLDAVQQLPLE